jgi:hypothetical protein
MDRDTFLEADEAKAFGIVDEVLRKSALYRQWTAKINKLRSSIWGLPWRSQQLASHIYVIDVAYRVGA